MRRRSAGSILLKSLDPKIKEKLLNLNVEKHLLEKFSEEEKTEEVAYLHDFRDLSSKNENEVYETLNRMFKNKK